MKSRVERAGAQWCGYAPGWFGANEWFPTWTEAMEHVLAGPLVSEATA